MGLRVRPDNEEDWDCLKERVEDTGHFRLTNRSQQGAISEEDLDAKHIKGNNRKATGYELLLRGPSDKKGRRRQQRLVAPKLTAEIEIHGKWRKLALYF